MQTRDARGRFVRIPRLYEPGLHIDQGNQGRAMVAPDGTIYMVPCNPWVEHWSVFERVQGNTRAEDWIRVQSDGGITDAQFWKAHTSRITQAQLDALSDIASAHLAYAETAGDWRGGEHKTAYRRLMQAISCSYEEDAA